MEFMESKVCFVKQQLLIDEQFKSISGLGSVVSTLTSNFDKNINRVNELPYLSEYRISFVLVEL